MNGPFHQFRMRSGDGSPELGIEQARNSDLAAISSLYVGAAAMTAYVALVQGKEAVSALQLAISQTDTSPLKRTGETLRTGGNVGVAVVASLATAEFAHLAWRGFKRCRSDKNHENN